MPVHRNPHPNEHKPQLPDGIFACNTPADLLKFISTEDLAALQGAAAGK
jgi:hypothetical protein